MESSSLLLYTPLQSWQCTVARHLVQSSHAQQTVDNSSESANPMRASTALLIHMLWHSAIDETLEATVMVSFEGI